MTIWELIEGFSPHEAWGKACAMNGFTLMLMSAIRKSIRKKDPDAYVVIHAGFATDGHSAKSQHYEGNAVDFHFVTKLRYDEQVDLMLAVLKDLQVNGRVGFGIYPDWNSPGFHIDCRGSYARWGYIDGQIYFGPEGFAKVYAYTLSKFKEEK